MNRLTVTKVHAIIVSQPTMLRNIGSSVVATAFAIQTEIPVGAMNKMGIVECGKLPTDKTRYTDAE